MNLKIVVMKKIVFVALLIYMSLYLIAEGYGLMDWVQWSKAWRNSL